VVIIPVVPKPETEAAVFEYAESLAKAIRAQHFNGVPIEVIVDRRDIRGGDKSWEWVKKGIPVRLEVGPRDIESQKAVLYRRDQAPREKAFVAFDEVAAVAGAISGAINSVRGLDQTATRPKRAMTSPSVAAWAARLTATSPPIKDQPVRSCLGSLSPNAVARSDQR
jgi:prolyl-tRNA synthetase